MFFGLIAYFLWREFSGRRSTAIWAGAAVAALAFNEGYSRVYLGMHWTTDVLSGWFYGILLLALFILATRVIMGPARTPDELAAGDPEAAPRRRAVRHGPPRGPGEPVSSDPERWPLVIGDPADPRPAGPGPRDDRLDRRPDLSRADRVPRGPRPGDTRSGPGRAGPRRTTRSA